jgi:hypothetical protein
MPHKEHHLGKFGNIVLLTFATTFYLHHYIQGMDCKGLNAAVTYAIYHLPAYKGICR